MGDSKLNWHIDSIEPNSSGTLEFEIDEIDPDDFYPIIVSFDSNQTLGDMEIAGVRDAETGEEYEFSCESSLIAKEFDLE